MLTSEVKKGREIKEVRKLQKDRRDGKENGVGPLERGKEKKQTEIDSLTVN